MKTGDIIKCPECGKQGEVRVYTRGNMNLVIHKAERGLLGFILITESCIVKKSEFK